MAVESEDAPARDLLIVDDDPIQAYLFEKFLRQLGLEHHCFYAPGGMEAMDFLRRRSRFQNVPRPDLILLDLKMPRMDGCAVLREIKCDADLRSIPVIIYSGTEDDEDIARCYQESANACVRKPQDSDGTIEVVRQIDRFWFRTAALSR